MTIQARVETDSFNQATGDRLVTLVLRYPRFIHAEFMTYRMFSRNAASSRAIPAKTMRQAVIDDPAMPVEWGANNPGMSSNRLLPKDKALNAEYLWLNARDKAVRLHEDMENQGVHKQILNRIIEPWLHIDVVATMSHPAYIHMIKERCHPSAQPEFRVLAEAIKKAIGDSWPTLVSEGQWHMPFLTPEEIGDSRGNSQLQEIDRRVSAARCARVSYNNHETRRPYQDDLALFDKLAVREPGNDEPKHLSPLEHVAMACPGQWANFRGFKSFRQVREGK